MRDPASIFAAFCICAAGPGICGAGLGVTALLDARAEKTQPAPERVCINICPDCTPYCERVPKAYFPPKP